MRNARPLPIAVPAFLLGCLVTAGLTTTAKAQIGPPGLNVPHNGPTGPKRLVGALRWEYKVVSSLADLNKWAA